MSQDGFLMAVSLAAARTSPAATTRSVNTTIVPMISDEDTMSA